MPVNWRPWYWNSDIEHWNLETFLSFIILFFGSSWALLCVYHYYLDLCPCYFISWALKHFTFKFTCSLPCKQENKCIVLNWPITTGIVVCRSITDLIYLMHMLLQVTYSFTSFLEALSCSYPNMVRVTLIGFYVVQISQFYFAV